MAHSVDLHLLATRESAPWDHRACSQASPKDLDLLALRQALQTAGLQEAERDVDDYLNEEFQISPFVPPCALESP